jgi:hypothetical protein
MHAQKTDSLLYPHQNLSTVCVEDFKELQEAGISCKLIADVLEGILLTAESTVQSRPSRKKTSNIFFQNKHPTPPIVGGKFKVELKEKELHEPWICPLSRSFQNICHERDDRDVDRLTEATITNIDNGFSCRVHYRIIDLIRHNFLPKGDYHLTPQLLIDCLELKTTSYEIIEEIDSVFRTIFPLTDEARNSAERYASAQYQIDDHAIGYKLPYQNPQHFIGNMLTVGQFSLEKGPISEETLLRLRENCAYWRQIEPTTIPLSAMDTWPLQKDIDEGTELIHIFNTIQRTDGFEIPEELGGITCDSIEEPGIYIFENRPNSYASIAPPPKAPKKRNRTFLERSNNGVSGLNTEPAGKTVKWKPTHFIKQEKPILRKSLHNTADYCMFLPITEEAQKTAQEHKRREVPLGRAAIGYILPYKDVPTANEEGDLFLPTQRPPATLITMFEGKYPLGEFVEKPGIYIYQLPQAYYQLNPNQ